MNPFKWVVESTRRKGIVQTATIAGSVVWDLYFDLRYGTDTMRWVEDRAALGARSPNLERSGIYAATKEKPLLTLLRHLELPRDCAFVDIGAGKGRVLLIAARYGFERVVGVEFSPTLCAVARQNVETFSRRVTNLSPIEIVEADATQYTFRPDERVLFLYNPFDAVVMRQVVDRLRRSLYMRPRRLWVIYNTPMQEHVLRESGLFQWETTHRLGGGDFVVYRT